MKKWIALLLAALLLLGLIGCAAKEEAPKTEAPKEEVKEESKDEVKEEVKEEAPAGDDFSGVTVTMMISQANYKDAYQTIMDKIEEDVGIKVDLQVLPDDQYFDAVNVKLTTGEVPDIFMNTVPAGYNEINAAETCIVLNDEPWVDRLVNPDSVKDKEGNIYAWPLEACGSLMGMCYNKEILKQAGYENPDPQTWDEFIEILDAIKEKVPDVTPLYMTDGESWTTQIMISASTSARLGARGSEVYEQVAANKLKMADVPEFKATLEDFKALIDAGYVNVDHLSATYDMGNDAVATGKAAMYNIPNFGAVEMANIAGSGDNIGMFVPPYGDTKSLSTSNALTGFLIPKDAENLEAAKKVLDLMSQPEYLNIYYAENPNNASFKDADGGPKLDCEIELIDTYVSVGNTVNEMPSALAEFTAVHGDWYNIYVELAGGVKTVDEVMDAVDAKNADYMKSIGQEGW